MNIRIMSALAVLISFLASTLLVAQPLFRSQGQNSVHTLLQQTVIHKKAQPVIIQEQPKIPQPAPDAQPIASDIPTIIKRIVPATISKPSSSPTTTATPSHKKAEPLSTAKKRTTPKRLKNTPSTFVKAPKKQSTQKSKSSLKQKAASKKPLSKNTTSAMQPSSLPLQEPVKNVPTLVQPETTATNRQEATQAHQKKSWVDSIKAKYHAVISYGKEVFASKPTNTALENNTALNLKNAALEVQSIDALGKPIAGNFMVTPEIMRSFRPQALSSMLFGCDLYPESLIHIRGSSVPHATEKDWLADYFYLSNAYEGNIKFSPHVTSFLTDLSLHLNFDTWFNGCFLRVQTPFTWTKWHLGMHEYVINNGTVAGAQGWKGVWTSVENKLLQTFTDYAAWEKAGTSYVDNAGLAHPLYVAKLCPKGISKTALADMHIDLGLYRYDAKNSSIGFYARGVLPTGTRAKGEWLFEPQIGNGHFFELGAGVYGSAKLWQKETRGQELRFYTDCSITHLFSSNQYRVFDLKDHGFLSRYLLLATSSSAPVSITPAANLTCASVQVQVPVQMDCVALLNFVSEVFAWNIGYNFWYRSCEHISCNCMQGSSVCDNCAASSGLDGVTWKPYANATLKNLGESTLTSALSLQDLAIQASATKAHTHKLFTSLTYAWTQLSDTVVPYLGIGSEIELGSKHPKTSGCCKQAALSQWGLWLRTGTEF